jgi:hypothetical protein
MTYKEFLVHRLEQAKKYEHFDEDGNNVVATANRSFFRSLRLDIKVFNSDIYHSVEWKELFWQLWGLMCFLTLPITYIPFLLLRHFVSKSNAHKEMKEEYLKKLLEREK